MIPDSTLPPDYQTIAGGSIPGAAAGRAYTVFRREPSPIPVLLAVPHAGRSYPPELLGQMRDAPGAGFKLEDRYVDLLARAVARETGAGLLLAHAPRAMIDLNRAPEEMDWDMLADGDDGEARETFRTARRARGGLGLVPRRLPGLGEIWKRRMTRAELDARLAGVHAPYHAALAGELKAIKGRWGAALLLDLHSMPPLGPKRGSQASADFVVGDRFGSSCDGALCAAAFDHFAAAGRRAAHNRPYAGGYVLDRHAAPARCIHGLQIEICRAVYLDERLQEPGQGFDAVAELLTGLVRRLASEFAALGSMRHAAE
uniref:N-formylglutamate amidohydrolase n=1 Tax=Altererythrobacter segetis TaxID=1104773 RepID=UPI001FAF26B1|nr:N-formylglutamate amidohydrolase [Altererythrobacter segetis]